MRAAQLQTLPLEVNAVEDQGLRRLVDAVEIEEGKFLVQVDLARQYGVALGLCQTQEVHLLVEEVHYILLGHTKRDVAHIQPIRLPSEGRTHQGHRRLRHLRDHVGQDLPGRLHRPVLHRRDVIVFIVFFCRVLFF